MYEQTGVRRPEKRIRRKKEEIDKDVYLIIKSVEKQLLNSLKPAYIKDLNSFQRKQVYRYFEKKESEYSIKTYKEEENTVIKVYPVGVLRRLAEQKTQEVLMNGREEELPPMGAYERFIIHDYLKDRGGVSTVSTGVSGKDRRIRIVPSYGRHLRKAKKRLTR